MSKRKYDVKKASKSIGLTVRSLREARGWTLEETEEYGWTSWQRLQKIESGQNVTLRTLLNLANLFGIHPSDLLKDI